MAKKLVQLVRQQGDSDCGVACLAMATGTKYDVAHEIFVKKGFHLARGHRKPYYSTFTELQQALDAAGYSSRRPRFSGWAVVQGPSILKVNARSNGKWHWVFADRHPELGLYLLDPEADLPAFEHRPLDIAHTRLRRFKPSGCFIEVRVAGS